MTPALSKGLEKKISVGCARVITYLHANSALIFMLGLVILTAFGFELFNINLTIDEEFAAFRTEINPAFITSGRWGLFLLTKVLLPKQVIPFIPLALTVCFQTAGMLLLLESLEICRHIDRILVAAFGLIWPGLAYLYSFSFVNFAAGFGFLCISLGLFILVKARRNLKFLAAVPITFVFAVYQPLLQPLVMVFLLFILYRWEKEQKYIFRFLFSAMVVAGMGYLIYIGIQQLFLVAYQTEISDYVSHYFDLKNLFQNLGIYILKLWKLFYNIMVGDVTFYGIAVRALPIFLSAGVGFVVFQESKRRGKLGYYLVFLVLLVIFSILPFIGGILTKGYIPYRSLLGVPILLLGWAALALKYAGPKTRILLSLLAVITLFQFALSMNHLFASSAFAYAEDKFLAGQLVQRIEEEKAKDGITDVAYLELVGYVDRPSTPLVSRIENIGASFFGWDGGHTERVVSFLKVLGYNSLEALPLYQRTDYVIEGVEMPAWPANDSVRIVGDVVMVKFSSYSNQQIKTLCATPKAAQLPESFCPLP